MIPETGFSTFYARFAGAQALLGLAQSNLMANLDRVTRVRTHTFLANNAQNERGISRNQGHERYYAWEDTTVDCRFAPILADEAGLTDFKDGIAKGSKFRAFKEFVEQHSGGKITVEPFYGVQRGSENLRYDIRRAGKVVDFDIVRVGVKLFAADENDFKQGLEAIRRSEDPFYNKKPVIAHRQRASELVQA